MRRAPFIALCLAALAVAAAAQTPDFSGRWTLDARAIATTPAVPGTPAAAAAPGDMGSGWGSTITVAQDSKQFSVQYPVYGRYDLQPPLTFVYALDGSESRTALMVGRGEQVETSRVKWSGQSLIIVTSSRVVDRAAGAPFTAEVRRTLRLESPAMLIVEVTRAGVLGGPSSTTRSVYRKESEP